MKRTVSGKIAVEAALCQKLSLTAPFIGNIEEDIE